MPYCVGGRPSHQASPQKNFTLLSRNEAFPAVVLSWSLLMGDHKYGLGSRDYTTAQTPAQRDHNRPRRSRPADFAFRHPLMPGSDRNEALSCDAVNTPPHFRSEMIRSARTCPRSATPDHRAVRLTLLAHPIFRNPRTPIGSQKFRGMGNAHNAGN